MSQPETVPIRALRTSFRVLEALKALDGAGPSEVAHRLDMANSTVHDHLRTLERIGYVTFDGDVYEIGPRFLDLGGYARSRKKLFRIAEPEVQRLAAEVGHHANLMIEDGGMGVFLYIAKGENAVHLDTYEGMRVHLQTTALGKAILAHLPTERVDAILDRHGYPSVTGNTLTDREALFEDLEAIRERGYAVDDEERINGIRCVSAPIRGEDGVLGAVSVSGPTSRMRGERFERGVPDAVSSVANIIEVNVNYS